MHSIVDRAIVGSSPIGPAINNMTQNLFIPTKLKVGFQERTDTFTKKLAYVIYYDEKNVSRKETSWKGWRDEKIPDQDIDNVPTEGFILNRKVGGYKSDWNYRQSYIRVYDPRGFEFEITPDNLLFILKESNCDKDKGLEGKFVYSWQGTELVLLPISSLTYQNSTKYTSIRSIKIKKKDLILGASYLDDQVQPCIYLGLNTVYGKEFFYGGLAGSTKQHVTYYTQTKKYSFTKEHKHLKELVDANISPDFSDLIDHFANSTCGSPIERLELRPMENYHYISYQNNKAIKRYFWAERSKFENTYDMYFNEYGSTHNYHIKITDNSLHTFNETGYTSTRPSSAPKKNQLFAILKNGNEIMINSSNYRFYDINNQCNYEFVQETKELE